MLEELYRWILNISVYLIVTAAVMHAIPGKEYEKYVRFFSGLVLILLLFTPLLKLTGKENGFRNAYLSNEDELDGRLSKRRRNGLRMSHFWNSSRRNIQEDNEHMMEKKDGKKG